MNTKQIALPLVVVIAVLLAFSSPAAANYSGDHALTMYEHGFVEDGGLIFETVTDNTTYTQLETVALGFPLDSMTQNITITIPACATVKTARLYNYVTWSKSDEGNKYVPGDPAEADLTLNGVKVTCQNPATTPIPNPIYYLNGVIQYWDTKGQGYAPPGETKYDYPSGTFAWDVTDIVKTGGSGTYVATIANNDSTPTGEAEYFATFGFGLLVVYEDCCCCGSDIEYWIDEGCDVLLNTSLWGVYEPIATTNATFPGCIEDVENKSADLTIVTMAPDKGYWLDWPASLNMNYFNGLTTDDEIGPSIIDPSISSGSPNPRTRTIGSSTLAGMWHGYNEYVLPRLQPCDNILYLQDRDLGTGRGDNIAVSNAFLVVKKTVISADVTIEPETLNLKSNGEWVTAYIELPAGYNVEDIDCSTISLECEIAADSCDRPNESVIGDHDMDDIPDLMVKFNRTAVIEYLGTYDFDGDTGNHRVADLSVTGKVAGTPFEGSDTVRVLH